MNGFGLCGEHRERCARFVRSAWVVLVVAWLAGCATLTKDSPEADKRKVVDARASARWALIIRGDSGAAYDDYMSKGSRQVISRNDFVERMKVTRFRSASVENVECGSESCKLSVRITYDHKLMSGVRNTLRENWVIEDGQAWYVWSQ
jgi:hypothetical protein